MDPIRFWFWYCYVLRALRGSISMLIWLQCARLWDLESKRSGGSLIEKQLDFDYENRQRWERVVGTRQLTYFRTSTPSHGERDIRAQIASIVRGVRD